MPWIPDDPAAFVSAGSALCGLVLLTGGLSLTPLAVVVARRLLPDRRVFFARWRFLHVFAVLGLSLGVTLAAGSVLLDSQAPLSEILVGQIATAAGLAAAALAIAALAARLDPAGLRSLGLQSGGNLRAIAAGVGAYLICLPALLGAMLLWPWLYGQLGGEFRFQEIVGQLVELSGWRLLAMLALAIAVQPFLEELFFRAFLQPLLVQNLGDRGGVALTSVLFAALHGGSAFLPILALSLLLGSLMLRGQRLSSVVLLHALHNGAMVGLLMLATQAGDARSSPGSG